MSAPAASLRHAGRIFGLSLQPFVATFDIGLHVQRMRDADREGKSDLFVTAGGL
jgi:hypothetical protein